MSKSRIMAAIALSVLSLTVSRAQAFDETKYPDWSGQWGRERDGGVPRYDPSKPLRAQDAPLRPEYKVRHEESVADQKMGGLGLDTAYSCLPQGMPRMMSGVSPMEFLLSPTTTHILFELTTLSPRRIYTDGRGWPTTGDTTFVGYSIGRWLDSDGDGRYDTLEVETRNIRTPRTWDQSGMPMADDGETVIKERIFLDRNDRSLLHNEMTTTDNSLTRPWTVMKNYRRARTVEWAENNCIEGNAWVTIGKEVYYLSGDGTIMPIKKGQKPPDPKYFGHE